MLTSTLILLRQSRYFQKLRIRSSNIYVCTGTVYLQPPAIYFMKIPQPPLLFFFQSLLLNFISSFAVYQKIKTVNTKSSAKLTHHLSFQAFLKRQTSSGYNFLFQQLTSLIWLCLVLSIDARVHSWASSCD